MDLRAFGNLHDGGFLVKILLVFGSFRLCNYTTLCVAAENNTVCFAVKNEKRCFDFTMNLKGEWIMTEFSFSTAPKSSNVPPLCAEADQTSSDMTGLRAG